MTLSSSFIEIRYFHRARWIPIRWWRTVFILVVENQWLDNVSQQSVLVWGWSLIVLYVTFMIGYLPMQITCFMHDKLVSFVDTKSLAFELQNKMQINLVSQHVLVLKSEWVSAQFFEQILIIFSVHNFWLDFFTCGLVIVT